MSVCTCADLQLLEKLPAFAPPVNSTEKLLVFLVVLLQAVQFSLMHSEQIIIKVHWK